MASAADDPQRDVGHDAGALGEAWRQFAREDAEMSAPPELERRVLAAWQALQHSAPRTTRRDQGSLFWAVGAMAGGLLLAIALSGTRTTVVPAPASRAATSAKQGAGESRSWPQSMRMTNAVFMLTADPPLETETLQLVRLRLPRLALQAVGVVVGGPNTEGFVEVDVVVGEDGLPRDVRRVALIP